MWPHRDEPREVGAGCVPVLFGSKEKLETLPDLQVELPRIVPEGWRKRCDLKSISGQTGWSSGPVEVVPGGEGCNKIIFKVPSNPKHSVML